MVFIEWKRICSGFFLSFVYICIAVGDPVIKKGGLGSSYQEERVWDPVIKRGGLEIQLSRWEGLGSSYQEGRIWDPAIKKGGFGIQLSRGEGLGSRYIFEKDGKFTTY